MAIREDHYLLSLGLHRILAAEPSIELVEETDRADPGEQKTPHILVVDGRMRGAFDCLRPGAERPWAILLAAESGEDWALRAITAGARGILSKDASATDLVKAIQVVHEGQIWAANPVIVRVIEELSSVFRLAYATSALLSQKVSGREMEVVHLAASGMSNREIANKMLITEGTVKSHLNKVFEKLGVRDRTQLAALYYRMVPLPSPEKAVPKSKN